ncbi:MAG: MATE family efflux transporter [Neofamilia sp.]
MNKNPLGYEDVSKLLITYSVPSIIGMVVNSLYNIVDRLFIGNAPDIGHNGLAAITIVFPMMLATNAIGLLFGVGGSTLYSIKLGEGDSEGAKNVLNNAFLSVLILGILLTVVGLIFLHPLAIMFGASKDTLPLAMDYMKIIFLGTTFAAMGMNMNNFLRAEGQPKLAMVSMIIAGLINIVLDYVFIFIFKMGMAGAAWATIIGQGFSVIWIMSYFFSKKSNYPIRFSELKPDLSVLLKIISFGMPNFLMSMSNSILNLTLNRNLLFYGGDIAVSGMGIVNTMQTMILMPIIGINQGVKPIASFNFGARKYSRVIEVEKLGIIAATGICLAGWIITRFFPEQIVLLFNREPELVSFGSYAIVSWFWLLPVVGFQMLASNFFQNIGRPNVSIILTLTRQIIFLIPAVFIFSNIWGLNGTIHAAPFADLSAAIVTGVFFYKGIQNLVQCEKDGYCNWDKN